MPPLPPLDPPSVGGLDWLLTVDTDLRAQLWRWEAGGRATLRPHAFLDLAQRGAAKQHRPVASAPLHFPAEARARGGTAAHTLLLLAAQQGVMHVVRVGWDDPTSPRLSAAALPTDAALRRGVPGLGDPAATVTTTRGLAFLWPGARGRDAAGALLAVLLHEAHQACRG